MSFIKLFFFNKIDKVSPIIPAVNSVRVAAPSSKDKPLEKDISKSFVSNDNFFFQSYSCKVLVLVLKLFHLYFH